MQPLPVATNIVSLNTAHGQVYSIQNYVIKSLTWVFKFNGLFCRSVLILKFQYFSLFKKSEFPAIPGNFFKKKVSWPFSYRSQAKSESHESWNCLLTFIFAAFGLTRVLTSLLAILSSTISTSSMDDDFDCLLAPVTESSLSLFHVW